MMNSGAFFRMPRPFCFHSIGIDPPDPPEYYWDDEEIPEEDEEESEGDDA